MMNGPPGGADAGTTVANSTVMPRTRWILAALSTVISAEAHAADIDPAHCPLMPGLPSAVNLDGCLTTHGGRVTANIAWMGPDGARVPYASWPATMRSALATAFNDLARGDGRPPVAAETYEQRTNVYLRPAEAQQLCIEGLAHALWLEWSGAVPWSLANWSDPELAWLLDCRHRLDIIPPGATATGSYVAGVDYAAPYHTGVVSPSVLWDIVRGRGNDIYWTLDLLQNYDGGVLDADVFVANLLYWTRLAWVHGPVSPSPAQRAFIDDMHGWARIEDRLKPRNYLDRRGYVMPTGCHDASMLLAESARVANVPLIPGTMSLPRGTVTSQGWTSTYGGSMHRGLVFGLGRPAAERVLVHTDLIYADAASTYSVDWDPAGFALSFQRSALRLLSAAMPMASDLSSRGFVYWPALMVPGGSDPRAPELCPNDNRATEDCGYTLGWFVRSDESWNTTYSPWTDPATGTTHTYTPDEANPHLLQTYARFQFQMAYELPALALAETWCSAAQQTTFFAPHYARHATVTAPGLGTLPSLSMFATRAAGATSYLGGCAAVAQRRADEATIRSTMWVVENYQRPAGQDWDMRWPGYPGYPISRSYGFLTATETWPAGIVGLTIEQTGTGPHVRCVYIATDPSGNVVDTVTSSGPDGIQRLSLAGHASRVDMRIESYGSAPGPQPRCRVLSFTSSSW